MILQVGRGVQQKTLDLYGKKCYVVAFGKAVAGMVAAVDSIIGDRIVSGVASVPTNIQREFIANGKRYMHNLTAFLQSSPHSMLSYALQYI